MKKSTLHRLARRAVRAASAALAVTLAALCISSAALPAQAATQQELQDQLAAYEQKLNEDKAALAALQQDAAAVAKRKTNLESQISTLKSQIQVLAQSISDVQNQIGQKEQEIAAKEEEIAQRQAEYDQQKADYGQRLAAMQQMNDGGSIAILASAKSLYQILTFSEALQDISRKDSEILADIARQKAELETAKAELETAKAELEAQQAELEAQKTTMQGKQSELSQDLVEVGRDLEEAQDEVADAQAVLDSDQMNYEAVYSQIQQLVLNAEGSYSDLAFDGSFICPLASYTRISSYFGNRTLGGVTKLHPGVDYAAPRGTTIRAAAGGVVTAAGWNSGGYGYYVLIYHGAQADGNTYSTLYAHMMEAPCVSAGSTVAQGQTIGYVGSTGNSTGNHLHLELWQGSSISNSVANKATRVNPLSYIG